MTTNEEIIKTCENCKYEFEDYEGEHCRHCIHNAEEHFELKEMNEKEIRNKAIDEFAEKLITDVESFEGIVNGIRADMLTLDYFTEYVDETAEQLKAGDGNV
jgi:hypothetical protein